MCLFIIKRKEKHLEIKINKEIRAYQESIFFGLSMRQFLCSVAAVGLGVIVYFSTRDVLHKEVVSWLCILSAAPIAAAGFITYHGLSLEKFILAWFKSEFMYPRQLFNKADNVYDNCMMEYYHRAALQQLKKEKLERVNLRKNKRSTKND